MLGRVVEFDSERGLGVLEADDGRTFGFHCAAIVDGSREIEVGTVVHFEASAGLMGRWEAHRMIKEVTPRSERARGELARGERR